MLKSINFTRLYFVFKLLLSFHSILILLVFRNTDAPPVLQFAFQYTVIVPPKENFKKGSISLHRYLEERVKSVSAIVFLFFLFSF